MTPQSENCWIQGVYSDYNEPNANHTALDNLMSGLQQQVTNNINNLETLQQTLQQGRINNIPTTATLNGTLNTWN